MNWSAVVPAVLAVCSLAGTVAMALLNRRKIRAEASKTGADAAAVLTGSALEMFKEVREELRDARVEIDALREHLEIIQGLLRASAPQVAVPPFRNPRLKIAEGK